MIGASRRVAAAVGGEVAGPEHRERRAVLARHALDGVWIGRFPGPGARPEPVRVLPDGCIDVVWDGAGLHVAGPDTRARTVARPPGATWLGVRFVPGAAPPVLGVPAHAVRDHTVPLAAVWAREDPERLEEVLASTPDPDRAAALLEAALAGRLTRAAAPDPVMPAVLGSLRAGRDVAATAARVGLSQRQLHRRTTAAVG